MKREETKGEWGYSVLKDTQIPATLYVNQNGNEIDIAVFEKWEQDWAKEEMVANARLMAAAPKTAQQRDDLLAALERLLSYHYHNHIGVKPKEYHEAKDAIAAAQPSRQSEVI